MTFKEGSIQEMTIPCMVNICKERPRRSESKRIREHYLPMFLNEVCQYYLLTETVRGNRSVIRVQKLYNGVCVLS